MHLLTPAFFRLCHVALTEGGTLTVLSDNRKYVHSLASVLGALRSGSSSAPSKMKKKIEKRKRKHSEEGEKEESALFEDFEQAGSDADIGGREQIDGVTVFRGTPGTTQQSLICC